MSADKDKASAGNSIRQRDEARRERDEARRERDDKSTKLEVSRADVDVLKATEELRELFIGVLAHDLSNPLGAILSTADLMLRRGALPEVEYEATAHIASSTAHALRMIKILAQLDEVLALGQAGELVLAVGEVPERW